MSSGPYFKRRARLRLEAPCEDLQSASRKLFLLRSSIKGSNPMEFTRRRIISLSMVKNEEDVIEPFIRHNARYVDFMVIVDNASVDNTRRITLDCARELNTIIVTDGDGFAYTQSERMTRMLHYCQSAFFADFVLFLDADEFISAPDRQTFEQSLNAIPSGGAGLMPWRTFVLTPAEIERASKDPPRSLRHRRSNETPLYRKAVLRLDGACRPDLHVEQGNHGIREASGKPVPTALLDDFHLMHFPVRSRDQFICKSVVGWMAYLARDPGARRERFGWQWRDGFDRVTAGRSALSDTDLCEISFRYAQCHTEIDWQKDVVEDNPPTDFTRLYSTGEYPDPVALIARSWEASLVPPDPLAELTRPSFNNQDLSVAETAFDAAWHWDNFFMDVAPFRYIAEKYRPSSVLDVACGVGAYLTLFKRLGADIIFGVDGMPANATALAENEYAAHDLSQPLSVTRAFDCVICVEVAEHLEARSAEVLLDTIAAHTDQTIIFSAAEPRQPGHGHINCQPISYWLAEWAQRGWVPDIADTFAMRCLATLSWFRRNIVVLRRGTVAEGSEANAILCAIGERTFVWYGQPPGIRSQAFSEPLPSTPAARAALKKVPDAGRSASATAAQANPNAEVISGRDNYLSVLGQFHAILAPELYLEIGVRNGGSLALARGRAVGVDPAFQITEPLTAETRLLRMTSDEFFGSNAAEVLTPAPDLCFIDGMHLFEYALRDFINIERQARAATIVVADDIFPNHPLQAARERVTRNWTGDVWKLLWILRKYRPDLLLSTINSSPTGLLVVAGLDPQNTVLTAQFDAIVAEAASLGAGELPDEILGRSGAIAPDAPELRAFLEAMRAGRLSGFVPQEFRSLIEEWRQRLDNLNSAPTPETVWNFAACSVGKSKDTVIASLVQRSIEGGTATLDLLVEMTNLLLRNGNPQLACDMAIRATALWPDDARLHHRLAVACSRLGRRDPAIDAAREAVRLAPKSPQYQEQLAQYLLELGQGAEAEAEIEARRAIELDGQSAVAHYLLSRALFGRSRFHEALMAARDAAGLDPNSVGYQRHRGYLALRQGELDEADTAFRRAIVLAPDIASSHHALSKVAERQGHLAGAIDAAREAVRLAPKSPQYQEQLAQYLLELGQGAEAEAEIEARRAIELDGQSAVAHYLLSRALFGRSRFHEALMAARDAAGLDPNSVGYQRHRGYLALRQGELDEADTAFRRAIVLAPDIASSHHALSKVAERQGHLAGAIDAAREAVRLAPKSPQYQEQLAQYLLELGQGAEAEAEIEARRAIELDGQSAVAHYLLSRALFGRSRFHEALMAARDAAGLDPNSVGYQRHRGYLALRQGELDEADTAFRRAIVLAPDIASSHHALSKVAERQGHLAAALECAMAACRLQPDDAGFSSWLETLKRKA